MSDKFSFLFHYLKKEKINIDQNEFIFQVQSHSNYPSLLAISDTLSFFKINNLATSIEKEHIEHLPDNFISLIKREGENPILTFTERIKDGFQYSESGKPASVTNEKFEEIFQNIILVAEQEEIESNAKKGNRSVFLSTIFFILIYLTSIFSNGFSIIIFSFVLLASIGVYLSLEAISHEFGIKTKFSEAVCNIAANSDCSAVIKSKKAKILNLLNFSDLSIAFFSAQLLGLLLFSISNQLENFYFISRLLLLISVPITFLSFYQQIIIAKKWCPICIAIVGLIYLELIILFVFDHPLNYSIDLKVVLYFLVSLVGSYLVTTFIKKTIKENFDLHSTITENNRFKRNYSLFKMALFASEKVQNKTIVSGDILLGNREAKLKIVVVSSPFCGHCKDLHKIISEILDRYKDRVCFDLRFNYDDTRGNDKSKKVHHTLTRIYFEEGQDVFIKTLHSWFENKDETKLILNKESAHSDLKINEILNKQFSWNHENNITFTPALIINGYHFPTQYDRSDLIYFINDLVDDDSFLVKI